MRNFGYVLNISPLFSVFGWTNVFYFSTRPLEFFGCPFSYDFYAPAS